MFFGQMPSEPRREPEHRADHHNVEQRRAQRVGELPGRDAAIAVYCRRDLLVAFDRTGAVTAAYGAAG